MMADRARRYRERLKVAKYGPEAAGVDMRGRHGNHARGDRNARWNGGVYRSTEGYVMRRVEEGHHLRQAHGYAYEHDLVMESVLGRPIDTSFEIVHHLNGIRDDNRPENLALETRVSHAREHSIAPGARDEAGRFTPENKRLRMNEWPEYLRVREMPEVTRAYFPVNSPGNPESSRALRDAEVERSSSPGLATPAGAPSALPSGGFGAIDGDGVPFPGLGNPGTAAVAGGGA